MALINFEVSNEKFKIHAKLLFAGEDIVIIIGGGETHIGAVGVSTPAVSPHFKDKIVSSSIITLPGHKDDIVCKLIGEKISKKLNKNICVITGIHYDNLTKEEIEEILNLCNMLIDKILEKLG